MILPIQASVQGYGGKPVTVYSVLDTDAGVLVIDVLADFRRERLGEAALLTNDPAIADRDVWFTNKDFAAAVGAYFGFKNWVATDGASPALVFGERAVRANPITVVERDGFDAQGIRYRLAESVENAHVAVLATCHYARQAEHQGGAGAVAAGNARQGGCCGCGMGSGNGGAEGQYPWCRPPPPCWHTRNVRWNGQSRGHRGGWWIMSNRCWQAGSATPRTRNQGSTLPKGLASCHW